jgi:multiple sugar transport system substrate-binding protein
MKTGRLILAMITIATLILTACGGQPAATTAATQPAGATAAASQPTTAAAAPTSAAGQNEVPAASTTGKIVYSFPADSVQVVMRPEQYEIFKTANPGVEVELLSVPEDGYDQKNMAMIAAGDKLDVFGSGDVFVAPFIHDGIAYDLTNLIQSDPTFNVDDFYPEILDFFKYQGHIYMLPGAYDVQRIFYNKKMFDDAKLAYPTEDWTWEDFKNMSAALTKGEGVDKQYGFMADTSWYVWMPYVWANGGNLWSEDGTQCTLDQPAAVEALDWYADFMRKGNSPSPSELSGLGMSGGDMFTTGKVAMVSSGGWDIPYFSEIKDFEWGQVALPKGPNGRATTLHLAMNLISSKSENPELSWQWLKFLASPEMYKYEAGKYGQGVPPRKSATEDLLKNPPADANPQALRNIEIGLKSVSFGRTLPKIINISEVLDDVVGPTLDLFWNGDISTAKEAATKICSEMKLVPMSK